ncbi:MAG: PDZ domain-containing protein [Gemmatimonadaceae bacterium]|nr:PDZ domain-containing protein [Gemmatimonadaceae bacterium]
MRLALSTALVVLAPCLPAQRPATPPGIAMSAGVSNVAYTVEFTRAHGARRSLRVTTTLTTTGREPLLLSLPAWTPGAYELSWFARNVSGFEVTGDGKPLTWDKLDADTWRVQPSGAQRVTVAFDYRADSLDNAMAWSRADFAFFNGTNLFLYPEGRDTAFPATVTVKTDDAWQVATGMSAATTPRTWTASNYHDLVDMPFFVGAFDLDSSQVDGKWVRLATYPAGKLGGDERKAFWGQLDRLYRPMIDVFGEAPYDAYTNLLVFTEETQGGSALEHANSHVGIYTPFIIGNDLLASITAHEIFHLWNVKRMRPAEMWPYRYDRAQPTTLLWVSEGITDYYADLTLLRAGVVDSSGFLALTHAKMEEVDALPQVALEDASLSTWIHPTDGTGYIYYPKGSLAGFALDVMIRDASDNASSLDAVMRDVYQRSYKQGRGFTTEEWWAAVARAARGKSFADFSARYIDGREPFPWSQVLALAGMRVMVDSIREPRLGVYTEQDSLGVRVTATDSGSAAQLAGVRVGDYLLAVGDVTVTEGFGERFRARYGRSDGQTVTVRVRRAGQETSLPLRVQLAVRTESRLAFDRTASPRAAKVRHGLLTGRHG